MIIARLLRAPAILPKNPCRPVGRGAASKAPAKEQQHAPTTEAEYSQYRVSQLSSLNTPFYPRYTPTSSGALTPAEFHQRFTPKCTENNVWNKAEESVISGRIVGWRAASKKLVFIDVARDGGRVQVLLKKDEWAGSQEFGTIRGALGMGDIIEVTGFPGRTPAGELSLTVRTLTLLAPCLRRIPKEITDIDSRYRHRHLDLLANPRSLDILRTRSQVIHLLRQFFQSRGFVEVETPVLGPKAGGASARPFKTWSNSLEREMVLRIAPELYLKRLVIGGFDKVYEIGKQFRNEAIDMTHNPEFTTLEFYQTLTDLDSTMELTEVVLRELVTGIVGKPFLQIEKHSASRPEPELIELDFSKPFQRIHVAQELEARVGPLGLDTTDPVSHLKAICQKHGVTVHEPHTVPRLLDTLISHYLEPLCIQPTFLTHHPLCMSPLAKQAETAGNIPLADRFELFINGFEFVNAYAELNDPHEQRRRFEQQMKDRQIGDDEAQIPDEEFCDALELGMPPTCGWGLGVDRLVMLLTGASRIREVIAFPTLRD
ncbi:hypothetical protein BC832DRAFT_289453 [Gaertneriomyces semiglobifer]|nr:hypothetical protein BC832DRAFT_289453 [Gaertneriomyces semiglobifer]